MNLRDKGLRLQDRPSQQPSVFSSRKLPSHNVEVAVAGIKRLPRVSS